MNGSDPPSGSSRSRATEDDRSSDRVSVIRTIQSNNHESAYARNESSNYFIENLVVVNNNGDGDKNDDNVVDNNNGDGDNEEGEQSTKKKAEYKTKTKKLMEKKADLDRKRMLYDAAVEDMKKNKFESFYSCAKHYQLNRTTLQRLHDTGAKFIGHNKSNRVSKLTYFNVMQSLQCCTIQLVVFGTGVRSSKLIVFLSSTADVFCFFFG